VALFLWLKYSMKFRLQTLVDITETKTRRQDENKFAYKQEANFQTVLQTIGMRTNLSYDKSPSFDNTTIGKMEFGDKYKGKHMLWTFEFDVEAEGAIDINTLNKDFNVIPIILGLNETANIEQALFRTTPQERNIIFETIE
jgi:hypothetical protein